MLRCVLAIQCSSTMQEHIMTPLMARLILHQNLTSVSKFTFHRLLHSTPPAPRLFPLLNTLIEFQKLGFCPTSNHLHTFFLRCKHPCSSCGNLQPHFLQHFLLHLHLPVHQCQQYCLTMFQGSQI